MLFFPKWWKTEWNLPSGPKRKFHDKLSLFCCKTNIAWFSTHPPSLQQHYDYHSLPFDTLNGTKLYCIHWNTLMSFLASWVQEIKTYRHWYKLINSQALWTYHIDNLGHHRNGDYEDSWEESLHHLWHIAFPHLISFTRHILVLMDTWWRMAGGFILVTIITSLNNWHKRGFALATWANKNYFHVADNLYSESQMHFQKLENSFSN